MAHAAAAIITITITNVITIISITVAISAMDAAAMTAVALTVTAAAFAAFAAAAVPALKNRREQLSQEDDQLRQRGARVRLQREHGVARHERLELGRVLRRVERLDVVVAVANLDRQLAVRVSLKGAGERQQLEEQHAERPHVGRLRIALARDL
eukprot:2346256-Pleurochrysis_carterae.AAC.2